jgi:hypothetical protein
MPWVIMVVSATEYQNDQSTIDRLPQHHPTELNVGNVADQGRYLFV